MVHIFQGDQISFMKKSSKMYPDPLLFDIIWHIIFIFS
jgi:hypothetical protein